jgi:hypothetical protein
VSRNDSACHGARTKASGNTATKSRSHTMLDHVSPWMTQAREQVSPWMTQAKGQATDGYVRMREVYLPRMSDSVGKSARQLAEASRPARAQATARGTAALAVLRGVVSPEDVERIIRKRERHTGRRMLLLGGMIGLASGIGVMVYRRTTATTAWIVDEEGAEADTEADRGDEEVIPLKQWVSEVAKGAADKMRDAAQRASDRVRGGSSDADADVADATGATGERSDEVSADARGNWP